MTVREMPGLRVRASSGEIISLIQYWALYKSQFITKQPINQHLLHKLSHTEYVKWDLVCEYHTKQEKGNARILSWHGHLKLQLAKCDYKTGFLDVCNSALISVQPLFWRPFWWFTAIPPIEILVPLRLLYFCNVMLVIMSGKNKTRFANCSVVGAVFCFAPGCWRGFRHQIMIFYSCCAINCENNDTNRPDLIFFHFPCYSSERFVRSTPNLILLYCTVLWYRSGILYNTVLQNLRLSRRCCWRYRSFGALV